MRINVGDYIYCHTNGYMLTGMNQFATKGCFYQIKSINPPYYDILDDNKCLHSFSIQELKDGCRWFNINEQIVINKDIKKISL